MNEPEALTLDDYENGLLAARTPDGSHWSPGHPTFGTVDEAGVFVCPIAGS